MLDSVTKRRIDTCRDILVGKIPDPKSQVEQITIALIYKFMDDMDLESEELGGERKFFTGEFERYAWGKLVAPGTSGQDMLNTYGEALQRMTENEKLPALFRDIFRNAYLPYRDPETLRSFLREIDGFTYDHSERLGDAFEYLLSVLGSQGDAGQFRTPRHIIDFMVALTDPKKDEIILDPACGTAGFLISSYKHILKANSSVVETDSIGEEESALERPIESPLRFSGDLLTPEDRQRLARNIKGYDISPDMVRLSLVNLYLHGFANPRVEEYDTLTSEDKWSEMADVILANPPFMSPRGGIQPHNRFSIAATRSEVLFVDYIAEHLTPRGRAAVIVPEGVIFQSGNAYKTLRKMLVENFLVAVVSLPAGVFNPYSGVKTSIIVLDRAAARASNNVGFFKIANDGFNLGAQRRPVDGSELPGVLAEVAEYLAHEGGTAWEGQFGRAVAKAEIAADGDYNLSGERYRSGATVTYDFDVVRLGEVCELNPSKRELADLSPETEVSFVPMADLAENDPAFTPTQVKPLGEVLNGYTYFRDGDVLVAKVTPCFENGKAGIALGLHNGIGFGSSEYYVLRPSARILPRLAYAIVRHPAFRKGAIASMTGTGGLQRVPKAYVERFEIPLPPLDVQREIVAEIEGYQKVIDGARAVLEHYRPYIAIDPAWPTATLGDASEAVMTGPFGTALKESDYTSEGIPVVNPKNIIEGKVSTDGIKRVAAETVERLKEFTVKPDDVIIGRRGEMGRCAVIQHGMDGWLCGTGCFVIKPAKNCCPDFLVLQISSPAGKQYLDQNAVGVTMKNLNQSVLSGMPIVLPELAAQQAIVAELEAERALVEANRQLVTRMEAKIEASIARVWGGAENAVSKEVGA